MAYPDLYSDETVVLNAQNIKVKSVSFDAVLTTRRLILVDSKKHLIAPQEILLATLRDIDVGENAIRDPTLTLSIITNTGATRQMILTFTKVSGGERRRECEEWAKSLRQNIASAVQHPIMPDTPPVTHPAAEPAPVRKEVTNIPVVPTQKKKIEIARPGPIKKIVEAPPAMPKPIESSSLPTGSFCNRCGNRVPPESAFCNKCGTPVVRDEDLDTYTPPPAPAEAPQVPQVHVATPPVFGAAADKKERPIEEVIHSIEPLIEDSVPRTVPAPIIPKQYPQPAAEPAVPAPEPAPAPAADPSDAPEIKWPVIGGTAAPAASPAPAPAGEPVPAADQPPSPPPHYPVPPAVPKKSRLIIIGAIALVLIAMIAAVFIFANPLGGSAATVTPTPTATPVETAVPTTEPTPEPTTEAIPAAVETPAGTGLPVTTEAPVIPIPTSGVWVHVVYDKEYKGSYGTPGMQTDITGTGEQYFQVPTSKGIVVAAIQKIDGSSGKLVVEVYKDGEKVADKSTVTPKGIAEIMVDLKPAPTPTTEAATTVPTTTVTTTTTAEANATATSPA